MIGTRWQQYQGKIGRLGLNFGLWVTILLLIAACNRNNAPTPDSTAGSTSTPLSSPTIEATSPATATLAGGMVTETVPATPTSVGAINPAVNGVVSPDGAGGTIFTSPRYSYTLNLPCCWLALPTSTTIGSTLTDGEAQGQNPAWGDLGERMREIESGAVMELIALLPDDQNAARPVAQLTVSVLPARGLTMDGYLAATEAELNQIANTNVLTAYVDSMLGAGSLPASVIEYTAAPTPATNNAEEIIAGYQVAFFGQDENSLIVLTFTTSTERFAELYADFLQIVRTVAFVEPSA